MTNKILLYICLLCCASLQLTAQSINQANGKPTLQSSTASSGVSALAVDNNTDGNYTNGSVTTTNSEANAWWQVDLQSTTNINLIKLYNRTDAFTNRLSNFYVFISETDLSGRSFSDILADCTVKSIYVANEAPKELNIPKTVSGRYVRVQLAGTNVLSLAEVQVYQATTPDSNCYDFCLVENFDSKLNGSIRDQEDWKANPPGALDGAIVDSNPSDAFTGKALMLDPNGVNFRGNAYKPLSSNSISDGNIGTLFFQILAEDLANTNSYFGLSDLTDPRLTDGGTGDLALYTDFEVQVSLKNSQMSIRNGATDSVLTNIQLKNDIIYSIWLVANNLNDTFEIFVQGGTYTFPTKGTIAGGNTTFAFRNGTTESLKTIYLLNSAENVNTGVLYFDHFYLDKNKANLSIPITVSPIYGYTAVETFDGLNLGAINGQNQWVSDSSGAVIATDPTNSTNKIMNLAAGNGTVYHNIPQIRDCEVGTVFFRFKRSGTIRSNFGLSDVVSPTEYADFESQLYVNSDKFTARNGGVTSATLETLDNNVWYCVWMVVNNPANTYQIYVQKNDETTPRKLGTEFTYRNGAGTNALTTFLIKQSQVGGITGTFSIDDIYIHHNEVNLSHPHNERCIHKKILDPNIPLDDPIVEKITTSGLSLIMEEFVTIPASSTTQPRTRINYLGHANDNSGRLFVNDLNNKFYVIVNGVVSTYLDISTTFPYFTDIPRLGSGFAFFAFHPEFATNGKFYTIHTESGNALTSYTPDYASLGTDDIQGVITEFTATNPTANVFAGTKRELLRVGFDTALHGFQQLSFNPNATQGSPDYGLLYISLGEGDENPIFSNGPQNLSKPHGKILRINPLGNNAPNGKYGIPPTNPFVGTSGALGEIWMYGFRNPHRFSWDTGGTNKMFIGNIGEKNIDGIYIGVAGANCGWNEREGSFLFKKTDPNNVYPLPENDNFGYTYPVAEYDHDEGFAIFGGFVYRGVKYPELQGKYIFGDIVNGRIFYIEESEMIQGQPFAKINEFIIYDGNGNKTTMLNLAGYTRADNRFGMDAQGEMYATSKQNGKIWRIKGQNTLNTNTAEQTAKIRVYPNPVDDILNIKLGDQYLGFVKITIMDTSGKKVKTTTTNSVSGDISIPIANLAKGLYIVSVSTNDINYDVKILKK